MTDNHDGERPAHDPGAGGGTEPSLRKGGRSGARWKVGEPPALPFLLGPLPPVLDAAGVAALLRLGSGEEALRLARRRVIPSVRMGKRRLFLRDSILDSLRAREDRALGDEEL